VLRLDGDGRLHREGVLVAPPPLVAASGEPLERDLVRVRVRGRVRGRGRGRGRVGVRVRVRAGARARVRVRFVVRFRDLSEEVCWRIHMDLSAPG